MSAMSAKERGDMAEKLLPIAAHLVTLVHGDGGPRDVHQALARLSAGQKDALLVILAGLVDPDQSMGAALGWLDFNEHGQTVVPAWGEHARVRDLAPEPELEDDDTFIDEAAVNQYTQGIPVRVTPRERLEAVVKCVARGLKYTDIDAMHGLKRNSTATFMSRSRRAFAARGEKFPELERPDEARSFTEKEVIAIRERSARGDTDMVIAMSYGVVPGLISNICRGRNYAKYGGPIRRAKSSKPSPQTRVVWAGGTPGYAQAS